MSGGSKEKAVNALLSLSQQGSKQGNDQQDEEEEEEDPDGMFHSQRLPAFNI
jgi:hypothetical protein